MKSLKNVTLLREDFDPEKEVSIISLMNQTGVSLSKAGSVYSALCPLHNDKDTPSLRIYPNTNSWCCFGSGCGDGRKLNGGGVVEWVKQKENLDYREALMWLRERFTTFTAPTLIEKEKPKPRIVPHRLVNYWHSLLSDREWFYSRGFTDETIDSEMWGWDGKRYIIPVWEGEPGKSICLGVRRRVVGSGTAPKYIGLDNHNPPTIWGRHHAQGQSMILAFAGELDAARAVQDGLPAISMVNGVWAFKQFENDWAIDWFPDAQYLLACYDKKEESAGGQLAHDWSGQKGFMTGRTFHWPPNFDGKDYCNWRDSGRTAQQFMNLIVMELKGN